MYLGEDSFFMSEFLGNYLKDKDKKIKILDLGSGRGIQAETCINLGFKDITASDIGEEEINYLKNKFKNIKIIKSDLFSNIQEKFDLIIFNPPYLPESRYDSRRDTTGGKFGDEIIFRFLEQAGNHLNENGEIILLLSSFTPRNKIKKLKWKIKKLDEKSLFFEKLEICQLKK
ncbi:DUF2431 domain-containing protein [Candidatus Pacearchaeota archaeon]|nr:DUF2431 domain-containing protein [Candidatus Pacearchaeota archaeon]